MTESLIVIVIGLVIIAAAAVVGPRLGIPAPLLLVAIGVAASFLPTFGSVEIDPEWILAGVLPPLLYSNAVSIPSMNFRREFGAISGLSVLLVIASALVLGVFFMLVMPDLSFAWCVAIGAIVSPTDAVATSIIKQTSVSKRVVAMLDGESLLNDATALVILRTAIVATAASFSFWGALGQFAYSVLIAVIVGLVVGSVNLAVRARITDPTTNTVISFAVPFAAGVPAELLGASGLFATVVAGLVTGFRAPRELSPQHRLSDGQNWRSIELVLEGAVFLTMGLRVKATVADVENDHGGLWSAVLIAAGALALTILVRTAYIAPLLRVLQARARRGHAMREKLQGMAERISSGDDKSDVLANVSRGRKVSDRRLNRIAVRVTRGLADIDYFLRQPLGWREGTAVVWAGMRGAVTVAAAQTLPENTPQRSVLVLIAFAVATMSLVFQGGTIGPLLRAITPPPDPDATDENDQVERTRLHELLRTVAGTVEVPTPPPAEALQPELFEQARDHRLAVLDAQRSALLDARDNGTFDADVLAHMLANLDADEIAIRMREIPGASR